MDSSQRLDALVAPLREDTVSGAAAIARTAAEVLYRAVEREAAETPGALRSFLADLGFRVLDAQPAMAPLVGLVGAVMRAAEGLDDVEEARIGALRAANAFAAAIDGRAAAVAGRGAALLPADGDILTLSASMTVLSALLHGPRRRGGVIVLESRPAGEGRETARALAAEGVPVRYAVDAAVATLTKECSAVLLGADSIGDRGVINKVGSLAAALSAQRKGVPVLVVADVTKILPPGFPQRLADHRPAEQVWAGEEGVEVWNRYFEVVPMELITTVATDGGTFSPSTLEAYRKRLDVPAELMAWARRRSEEGP